MRVLGWCRRIERGISDITLYAPVVEFADTPDLGSGPQGCRFKSCQAHQESPIILLSVAETGYSEDISISCMNQVKNHICSVEAIHCII